MTRTPGRFSKRSFAVVACTLVLGATMLLAAPTGVVTTVDGEKHEGEIVESDTEVIIRAHGVQSVLPREQVASIDYTGYAERFEEALGALAADDIDGRLSLAREAFERHEYLLASKATDGALGIDPLNRTARQLDSLINAQIQLEARSATQPARSSEATETSDLPRPRPTTRRYHGLNEDQVNRVRQAELSQDDRVRIQFRDNVRKRYVDSIPGGNFRAFATRSDVDQALTILGTAKPEFTDDIIIRNDPRGIQMFQRRIQTAVVQGCATSSCHGGSAAGDFRLLNNNLDNAAMVTNFYLLNVYSKQLDPQQSTGIFSPAAAHMVDRGRAKDSLLYQYALPRSQAKIKHPQVRNWDGLFRSDDDRLAKELAAWMNDELVRFPAEYGFHFELPTDARLSTSTAPTTEPTSEPTSEPADDSAIATDATSEPTSQPVDAPMSDR